jgi:hypothetical protein
MDPINFLIVELLYIFVPLIVFIALFFIKDFPYLLAILIQSVCLIIIYVHSKRFLLNRNKILKYTDIYINIILFVLLCIIIIYLYKYGLNSTSFVILGLFIGLVLYITHFLKEKLLNVKFVWFTKEIDLTITPISIFLTYIFYKYDKYISLCFFADSVYHILEIVIEIIKYIHY